MLVILTRYHGLALAGSSPESVGTLVAREAMDIAANGVSMDEVVPVQKAARASLLVLPTFLFAFTSFTFDLLHIAGLNLNNYIKQVKGVNVFC